MCIYKATVLTGVYVEHQFTCSTCACSVLSYMITDGINVVVFQTLDVLTEKLSHAKEENLDMNQMLEQTLLELNNM